MLSVMCVYAEGKKRLVAIMRPRPENLRKRLWSNLNGEDALDYGGVER